MRTQRIKEFLLEDSIIDGQKILDYAFEKLHKKKSSIEIQKKVNKILKKAKNEKDALKKIDELKERLSTKEEAFYDRIKSYLAD